MTAVAFTAPHALAADIGLQFLKEGAHAVDAMVAAAAAITVVYPHMNSIGGDGFWLIQAPGEKPLAIDASGTAARGCAIDDYLDKQYSAVPARGPDACITMAGTIAGWQLAREAVSGKRVSLPDLLAPAAQLAKEGIAVTASLETASRKCLTEIDAIAESDGVFDDFRSVFSNNGAPIKAGDIIRNTCLGDVFDHLGHDGLDDFYRGDIAATLAKGLQRFSSVIGPQDFNDYRAHLREPLHTHIRSGTLYNMTAPTQGLASLLILAIYDRCHRSGMSEADRVHLLIEATKHAFLVRDKRIADPARMLIPAQHYLDDSCITALAEAINGKATPWPREAEPGDTVWMGCADKNGVMVSFIQSVYWEFGAGILIPGTGVVWNNRGSSFHLDPRHHNALAPGMKPFHTLNPALAVFDDGRRCVYGTMGGEGQPQTQAAIFVRRFYEDLDLDESIARGRWLLGRTWGEQNTDLKMEEDLYSRIGLALEARGHAMSVVPSHSEMMGHAGAIILNSRNVECATDPRSDGAGLMATV